MRVHRRVSWAALTVLCALLSARPAEGQITVTGRTLVERQVAAGDRYEDAIVIRNTSDHVQVANLVQADYHFAAGSSSQFAPAGSTKRSNAAWITLSQAEVSVPPRGEISVSYSVKVAPSETQGQEGTFWSVILVEGETPDAPAPAAGTITLLTKIRYAVQVVTHIGTSGEPRVTLGEPHVDSRKLTLDITHVGTRAVRPSLRVEMYRADGERVHAQTVQGGMLYPTTSVRHAFELPQLAPGVYTALLLADLGSNTVQGAKYAVHIP